MTLNDLLNPWRSLSREVALASIGTSENLSSDLRAAVQAYLDVQDQGLSRLVQGDASMVWTDAHARAESTRLPVQTAGVPAGLKAPLWIQSAVERHRWDAVAVWLEKNGVLSLDRSQQQSLSGELWHEIMVDLQQDPTMTGPVQNVLDQLNARWLNAEPALYRREVIASLGVLYDPKVVPPFRASGLAWVDGRLAARSLDVAALSSHEAQTLPIASCTEVQAHLVRAERLQLEALLARPNRPALAVPRIVRRL